MFSFLRKILLGALFAALASQASAMFIQPDWFDPSNNGVGTNRYSYSQNDPINSRDPNGNEALKDYDLSQEDADRVNEEAARKREAIAYRMRTNPTFGDRISTILGTGPGFHELAAQEIRARIGLSAEQRRAYDDAQIESISNAISGIATAGALARVPKQGYSAVQNLPKTDVPTIKSGSAGGPTAGKRFPEEVRRKAFAENPKAICSYCGGTGSQVDHVIPKSRGGNATIENAQITCAHCNASKGARDFPVTPPPGYRGDWPPSWW